MTAPRACTGACTPQNRCAACLVAEATPFEVTVFPSRFLADGQRSRGEYPKTLMVSWLEYDRFIELVVDK